MMVVKALISGGTAPFLILAWTKVERDSIWLVPDKRPLPLVKAVTMKSSKERVKERRRPEKMPGRI